MKPEYKPVDYAMAYGTLSGAIKLLSYYEQYPEQFMELAKRLIEIERDVGADLNAQHERNMKALRNETT